MPPRCPARSLAPRRPALPHRPRPPAPRHALPPSSCPDWHPLASPSLWSGDEAASLAPTSPVAALPPPWKVLLLSDGSVTRHLHLLTGWPPSVRVLEMGPLPPGARDDLPDGAHLLRPPLTQRRVLLAHGATGAPLVYAASWWNEGEAAAALGAAPDRPMWSSLAATRSELFREVRAVYHGGCPFLEGVFEQGEGGGEREGGGGQGPRRPLWGRHYIFWRGGAPLTVVYEVFSPGLDAYLGPQG